MVRLTVIVPVRNEIGRLPRVLAGLAAQTLQPDEVIFVDGLSTDGTREHLDKVSSTMPLLRVVDNPGRVVPDALNVGLREARGDVVARLDAHADYAADYLERVTAVLDATPEVVGVGSMMTTAGSGVWGQAIATVLSRPFGLGGARHRVKGEGGPVEHIFTGAYRRAELHAAGGWDEQQLANEDAEMDIRLRKAGGVLWLAPTAASTWYVRQSLRALSLQMWRYGYYRSRTVLMHPDSLRARQLAPAAVVVGLPILLMGSRRVGLTAAAAYLLATTSLSARAAGQDGVSRWRACLVTPTVHLAWGSGLVSGLVSHGLRGSRPVPVSGTHA